MLSPLPGALIIACGLFSCGSRRRLYAIAASAAWIQGDRRDIGQTDWLGRGLFVDVLARLVDAGSCFENRW
ncbi:hypothetical protein [Rosistilla oblonga]|uniref:hypothetical protein n=1 Tax=Rosistilla oblonga TaxID=2527990 RepID=UPI003A9753F7